MTKKTLKFGSVASAISLVLTGCFNGGNTSGNNSAIEASTSSVTPSTMAITLFNNSTIGTTVNLTPPADLTHFSLYSPGVSWCNDRLCSNPCSGTSFSLKSKTSCSIYIHANASGQTVTSSLQVNAVGKLFNYTLTNTQDIFAAGWFDRADGIAVNGFAVWDGTSWHAGPNEIQQILDPNGFVNNTAIDSTGMFYMTYMVVTGSTYTPKIIRWNGEKVTDLGEVADTLPYATPWMGPIVFDNNDKMYIGGTFNSIGGVPVNNVAMWDPATSTWSPLGPGNGAGGNYFNEYVSSLLIHNGILYMSGLFQNAGNNVLANNIIGWSPTQGWLPFINSQGMSGTGVAFPGGMGTIDALAFANNRLYIGGTYSNIPTPANNPALNANNINFWDGSNWQQVVENGANTASNGVNDSVDAIESDSNNDLYFSGEFTATGDGSKPLHAIAKWQPASSQWDDLDGGVIVSSTPNHNAVVQITTMDNNGKLYVGGLFDTAGSISARNIAIWDPQHRTWSAARTGVYYADRLLAQVDTLTVDNTLTIQSN